MVAHPIKIALLSVYDKTDIIPLVQALVNARVHIVASKGTAHTLEKAGISCTSVSAFTGTQESLNGRVKTVHPAIFAGILADRRSSQHMRTLQENEFVPIDLVVCNLYPFTEVLAEGADDDTMIEMIDIGGPALLRAAAKNVDGGVTVLSNPRDYAKLIELLRHNTGVPMPLRRHWAALAWMHVAAYDQAIAAWSSQWLQPSGDESLGESAELPVHLPIAQRLKSLRYGENPHQDAALYHIPGEYGLTDGKLLQGQALSYNNYLDMDAALHAVAALPKCACSVIKHTNPCGLAYADDLVEALRKALSGDELASFGSVLGCNTAFTLAAAKLLVDSDKFVECIAAPEFSQSVCTVLAKRPNLRLLVVDLQRLQRHWHAHRISGGFLLQQPDQPNLGDHSPVLPQHWDIVTERGSAELSEAQIVDLKFAEVAVTVMKSNAIAVVKDKTLVGVGCGQTSRIDATNAALRKAGPRAHGAIMASDGFFPFDDCIKAAADAGISVVLQPGGSKRDQDSIDGCNQNHMVMVLTHQRLFRH